MDIRIDAETADYLTDSTVIAAVAKATGKSEAEIVETASALQRAAWADQNACAANGVTSDGRSYHSSAAHNGYVFDE